jgi:hypothetical protein
MRLWLEPMEKDGHKSDKKLEFEGNNIHLVPLDSSISKACSIYLHLS